MMIFPSLADVKQDERANPTKDGRNTDEVRVDRQRPFHQKLM
jgi:hypothetical protein